jgi:hypothetical protein
MFTVSRSQTNWLASRCRPIQRNIPENINFAIETGPLRDFLDNRVVPYQISDVRAELKTADIARSARAFTFLISCKAKAKETARNSGLGLCSCVLEACARLRTERECSSLRMRILKLF